MFGINDNKGVNISTDNAQPLESAVTSSMQPADPAPPLDSTSSNELPSLQTVGAPAPTPIMSKPSAPVINPPQAHPEPTAPVPTVDPPAPAAAEPAHDDELLGIKQEALNNLAPLVGKLDQTPEEKFKTTMMLMQASDNPALVKEAYDAANQIKDEKARAQALLDVVNEINYFTHSNNT